MNIRLASVEDAEAACHVLRRSIEELCEADHRNDPAFKQEWLANKTPQSLRQWITAPEGRVLVAEIDGRVAGVGAATMRGDITLNYVAPEARFRGVSKAMLAALEAYLRDQGASHARLSSTRTARSFYLAAGYSEAPEPQCAQGLACQPMVKALV